MLKSATTVLLTFIAIPAYANVSCPAPAIGAFTACFYDNLALDGDPAVVRTDPKIAFEWGGAPPDPALSRLFSVRWQGYFVFDGGESVFTATTSDGIRLYIDGVSILDRWRDQPPYIYVVRPSLKAGTHLVTVEYYKRSGWGIATLSWPQPAGEVRTPAILSFGATPTGITAGQMATLAWNVSGATTVSLDNGIGVVASSGSRVVSPVQTVNYTLTATNNSGIVSSGSAVVVNAAGALQNIILPGNLTVSPGDTLSFPVTLATAAPSGGVFMTLSSSDPSIATLGPNYILISEGRTTATSTPKLVGIRGGSVTLTASAFGLATASAQVQVGSPAPAPSPVMGAPVVTSFASSPSSIASGGSTTLSWKISGASLVAIDNGVGDVSNAIGRTLAPTKTTEYTLTATNKGGSTVVRTTVTVAPPPNAQPPTTPVLLSAAAKSATEIDLLWTASTGASGIAGYQIFRNGLQAAMVSGVALTYADTSLVANTSYSYSVRAFDGAANYSIASTTLSATTPTSTLGSAVISTCQSITQSGHYQLTANLSAPQNASCLTIHDTHDVYIDCQQHSVTIDRRMNPGNGSAIALFNVNGYSITNCRLVALNTSSSASLPVFLATTSPLGVITNNLFSGGYISFDRSDRLEIAHNTSNAPIAVSGVNETIEYNTVTLVPGSYVAGAALAVSDSTGSTVRYNVIDGGWDGVLRQSYSLEPGSDDGILLSNVSSSIIQNNTIRNVWDAGIENMKPMVNVQVLNNQITTAGICGLGGWYGNALNNVTIEGNTVTDSPRLLDYWRADGFYVGSGEQKVVFADNTFSGNSLVKPRLSFATYGSGRLDFQSLPYGIPTGAVVSGRNKMAGNDFGPFGGGITLLPGSSVIDGGGNICTPEAPSTFPLRCNTPLPPAGGYYALAASPVAPTVVAPGATVVVLFGANPAGVGDYIGLAAVGIGDQYWQSIQNTRGLSKNTLVFVAPPAPGLYEFRYMKAGASNHVAVSNSITVAQ